MSRKKTTGRFSTRFELVKKIMFLYSKGGMTAQAIADNVEVSQATVLNIIDGQLRMRATANRTLLAQ